MSSSRSQLRGFADWRIIEVPSTLFDGIPPPAFVPVFPPAPVMSRLLHLLLLLLVLFVAGLAGRTAGAAEPEGKSLERRFAEDVQPFLKRYCFSCHGEKKQEAKLDFRSYSSLPGVEKNYRTWETVLERLDAEEMPPEKASKQPTAHERRTVTEWIEAVGEDVVRRNAGDPGPVLGRRLSNAEFDYTIRDLTGVDIRPTREFPVDPANEAGFDNSGESLAMSTLLAKKYLAAARFVAEHLVLKPQGFVFAPHPAVTDTDRDKYCVHRIIAFYERHKVDYAEYLYTAWRYQNRAAFGRPDATLADIARHAGLSAKYLATLWPVLTESEPAPGPLGEVQTAWQKLPADLDKRDDVHLECRKIRDLVVKSRKEFAPSVEKMHVSGISDGSQPFVLWKNRQLAARHTTYAPSKDGVEPALEAAVIKFCRVFPDAFFVSDRGPYFDPKAAGQGRLLTAGFHLMQGFFRDDEPLHEMVLDEAGQRELDELWKELNFITLVPIRQYKDFIFFERAEPPRFMQEATFDFARSEDKDSVSEAKMKRLEELHLAKARKLGASDEALEAIAAYYANISASIRWVEQARQAAEPSHLEALLNFAGRAYRRPLSPAERDGVLAFYRELREKDELNHEEALRDSIASVLLSPHFCFRLDRSEAGDAARPLSDYALASRLSYFLWSSLPDDELLARAAAGDLHQPDVLVGQTRRMLRDRRARGLATEFAGHWLEFRRFEEHNAVDRERFASFTNELRQAMFEEPLRFFIDVAANNRSVLDFLYAGHTFVNPILAKHYGMIVSIGAADEWVRIDDATRYGRGGLLPMAVFLTRNSPGLRTSPVKRGYWVVRRLLGENIPPPPPEVPELPKDEATFGELTLPQLLARHRDHKACAGCHQRFDSIGLVFEGYGPIGERRERDLGGRSVENKATFPDGSEGIGPAGLRRYLHVKREDQFVENLCRKLFAYALGRSLIPSDKAAVATLREKLAADGHAFGTLVESIVTSPQFLNRRGKDDSRE
jgi:hypothetical protein